MLNLGSKTRGLAHDRSSKSFLVVRFLIAMIIASFVGTVVMGVAIFSCVHGANF